MTSAGTAGAVDTASWPVWSTTAVVVVTAPSTLGAARALVEQELAAVDQAASRFRADSELNELRHADGRSHRVSRLLADLIGTALDAAEETEGDVDPTLGNALAALGYDRDISEVRRIDRPAPARAAVTKARPGWQRVTVIGDVVTVPAGVTLDLGATAKAWTADRCADLVARTLETGVLVSLGGDIATAGPGPDGGWRVLVQDQPGDPAQVVTLPAGHAIATSSTVSRQWRQGGRVLHHILDPRTCAPADPVWRSATVASTTCVHANTLSTAALVRGLDAPAWLRAHGVPTRLVTRSREIVTVNWPRAPR